MASFMFPQTQPASEQCEVLEMIQHSHFTQTISSPFTPAQPDLARTISALQQLQIVCAAQGDVSLADVIQTVRDMQREFGEDSRLEHVIQSLVGQHLSQQLLTRQLGRQQHHTEADASELRPRPSVEATACGRLTVSENSFMRSEP
jgi:hypothetical protein